MVLRFCNENKPINAREIYDIILEAFFLQFFHVTINNVHIYKRIPYVNFL